MITSGGPWTWRQWILLPYIVAKALGWVFVGMGQMMLLVALYEWRQGRLKQLVA